jgi:putative ABC transport system permease protein
MPTMFETVVREIQLAARTLRKAPTYTIVAVLTLALGIGANTAIFSVINGVLVRPLPFSNGDRMVRVRQPVAYGNIADAAFSPTELNDYRTQTRLFESLVEFHSMSFNMIGRGEPHRVQTAVVSASFFAALGVHPLLGRTFRAGEDEAGAAPVLILSHEFWRTRLGGDSSIIGQSVEMTDRLHTVIGVLPPLPQFPNQNDVFMPVSSCPFRMADNVRSTRTARMVSVFGLLKPGVTLEQASGDLEVVAQRLHADHPDAYPEARQFGVSATALHEELTATARPTLILLLATAGFVLLIACANVANLTLVRFIRRRNELLVRSALGASRAQLVRQLLTESLLLSLAGAGLGLIIPFAARGTLSSFASRFTPRAQEIQIDLPVLGFAALVAILTGLIFGTLPIFAVLRRLSAGLRTRGGAVAQATVGRRRLEHSLVIGQLAVSLVLLVAAGLSARSLLALRSVEGGYDPGSVLTMRFTLSRDKYTSADLIRTFNDAVLQRAPQLPGVQRAALALTFPLNAGQPFSQSFSIEGRVLANEDLRPQAEIRIASPDYFLTIGVPLLRGRTFTADDRPGSLPVAVINQSMARRHWADGNPLGARISNDGGQSWATIVGVVGDVRQYGLDREPVDEVYVPHTQAPILGGRLLLQTQGDPLRLAPSVIALMRGLDPTVPVDQIQTLDQAREGSMAARRLTATLLLLFATLALTIAAVGMGGVLAFSVSQRTQEIGVRMALGAARVEVLGMVLRQGSLLVAAGLAAGMIGSIALTRFMSGFVFGVAPNDFVTFAIVCPILAAVGLLACLGPARRASAIDPMVALRTD